MKTTEEIFEILKNKFPESVIGISNMPPEKIIDVKPDAIYNISAYLINDPELDFDNLMLLSGLDDANGTKTNLPDGSIEFIGGTLSTVYHIESTKHRHKLVLRVTVPKDNPITESVVKIWASADWHERESYDMVGIKYNNHPNLIRILMPYDWDAGHPLRKDYKNPEFYQGMKVPY